MYIKSLEKLILEFKKLPGVGQKNAVRYAMYILDQTNEEVENFAKSLQTVKNNIKKCKICSNYSEDDICEICSDSTRDKKIICVVEEAKDIFSLEKSTSYNGLYHVLNGKIDPLNDITIEKLNIKSLLERIENENIEEVILAINPDLDGEATLMFLSKLLKNYNVKITRLARGIPMGGNLEFSDIATISMALEDRKEF